MRIMTTKDFYILFILLYMTVILVMPLTDIHVEYGETGAGFTSAQSYSGERSFLVFLHELLFSHFGNKVQHAKYPHLNFLKSKKLIKKLHTPYKTKHASSMHLHKGKEIPLLHEYPAEVPAAENHVRQLCCGYSSLYSGLSPPVS